MTGLIVHEWLETAGGAERVVDEFVRQFPDADLQVLWTDAPGRYDREPRETWLAHTPLRKSKALALPLLPVTWRTVRMRSDYEWALISSHLFAHHLRTTRRSFKIPKFVYAHTPARYIWEPDLDSRGTSLPARMASAALKPLDRKRAQEAESIAANSKFTRGRIRRTWERDAEVIYPPVDTHSIINGAPWSNQVTEQERNLLDSLPGDFLLGASRFVRYKRLDLAIEAGAATGIPVVLAGAGPLENELRSKAQEASVEVQIVNRPSDALLRALYERCLAFIFPSVEDFGIMPIEAMAAGAPVIAASEGGAAESVGLTAGGATVANFFPQEWRDAFAAVQGIDRASLPGRTEAFSADRFREQVARWITNGDT